MFVLERYARRRISDVQNLSSATFFAVFLRRFKNKKRSRAEESPSPLLLFLQDEWECRGRLALDEAEKRFFMARRMRSTAIPAEPKRGREAQATTKLQRRARQRGDEEEEEVDDDVEDNDGDEDDN